MTSDDLKSEINYIRTIAEAGQDAPLIGGRFALWWGALATLTLASHWAIYTGRAPVGPDMLFALWIGFIILGSIGSAVMGMTMRDKPGAGSVGNRVSSVIWRSSGFVILTYFAAVTLAVMTGRLEPVFFNTILPVALLAYALAWLVIGGVTRRLMWTATGIVTLAGAFISVILVTTADVYLVTAATILVTHIPQGLAMMRREPASTV